MLRNYGWLKSDKGLTVKQSMLWNTFGSIVYLVCNWFTTVLVVVLGTDISSSGSLAVAMSVGNIYATIVLLRARPVQVSGIHPEFSAAHYIAHRFFAVGAASIFCLVYSLWTVASPDWPVVALYCLFKAADSFVDVFHGIDQINNRLDYAAISQILRGLGLLVGFSVGLAYFRSLLVAVFFMAIISILVVLAFDSVVTARFGSLTPAFDLSVLINLTKVCFPGFLASLACTSVVSIVRQSYGLAYGNEQLGIYAAVATPTAVVQALVTYLYAPLLGPLSEDWRERKMGSLLETLRRVFVAVLVAALVCVVCALVLGEPVLTIIYGTQIGSHSSYLPLMLIATALTGLMFFSIDLSISVEKPSYGVISSFVALIVAVLLSKSLFGSQVFSNDANVISYVVTISYGMGLLLSMILITRRIRRFDSASDSK